MPGSRYHDDKEVIMKALLIASIFLFSFSGIASDWYTRDAADPKICGAKSSCTKGLFSFVNVGTYYARGVSLKSCDEAVARAEENFRRSFGNVDDCGLFSGPSLKDWSCARQNDRTVAWVTCDPSSGSNETSRTQRRSCVLGGVWICGK